MIVPLPPVLIGMAALGSLVVLATFALRGHLARDVREAA